MLKAYTLRSEYKDSFVGGMVVTGPEANPMDVKKTLDENNGEIVTDDAMLQGILENYYGEFGAVFDVAEVDGNDRRPITQIDPMTATGEGDLKPHTSVSGETANAVPAAQHGEQSDYSTFTVDELKETLTERNIDVPVRASKQELVNALENDDSEREGASNGS